MSRFRVVPFDVDAASPDTWTAFHAHRRAIAAEFYSDVATLDDAECEYQMRRSARFLDARRWVALDGRDVVGFASAWHPQTPSAEEHTPLLNCYLDVGAATRRKGVGTLLLRQVHALMHAWNKSMLTVSVDTDPGNAFLKHVGAVATHTMLESYTHLKDLDWPDLRKWEGIAEDLGLVWECYAGRVPREVLMRLLPQLTALMRLEIELYDRWYETLDRTGGAHHLILLREPGGAVVAMSEACWDGQNPKIVYHRFTVVAQPWRRRGLNRAVTAAILRQIRTSHPDVEELSALNEEDNAAILSFNRHVAGYSVRRRQVNYQITRAELDRKLQAAGGDASHEVGQSLPSPLHGRATGL